jgi:hypothetical protein
MKIVNRRREDIHLRRMSAPSWVSEDSTATYPRSMVPAFKITDSPLAQSAAITNAMPARISFELTVPP